MGQSSDLLTKLLDYVLEQSKDINPRGFRLTGTNGFLRTRGDLAGLPGVDLDVKVEGDHIWLRVARLEAHSPPVVPLEAKDIFVVDTDPAGMPPRNDETALKRLLTERANGKPEPQAQQLMERDCAAFEKALAEYTSLWLAWAEGEKPRRKSISLYGELFTLKQQVELEDTANPQELVCGIGVASWKLQFDERTSTTAFDYQYPILTQTLELAIDDQTLAIEVRPRALATRIAFDAFAACQLMSAAAVERIVKEELAKSNERPLNPFDPGSYEHALRCVAGNLDRGGRYVTGQMGLPAAEAALLVTDLWVLHSRPRPNNYLHDDIERLKGRLKEGISIPEGPLALVTPPADEQAVY